MTGTAAKDPKQELNEIYQKFKLEPPKYECRQEITEGPAGLSENRWVCQLQLATITTESGEQFPATTSIGEGKKINQAKTNAAKEGLSLLKGSKVLEGPRKPEQHVSEIIKSFVGAKSGRAHLELAGALIMARQWMDGWIPLTYLTNLSTVKKWLMERHPQNIKNNELMMRMLRQHLRDELMAEGNEEGSGVLQLSEDGLSLKVNGNKQEGSAPRKLDAEVEEGRMVAMLIPVEASEQLQQIPLDVTKSPLSQMASFLSCTPKELVIWDRVGVKSSYTVNPRDLIPPPPTTRDAAQDSLISDMEPAVSSGRTATENALTGEGTSRLKTIRSSALRQMSVGSPIMGQAIMKRMLTLSTAATEEHKGPAAMDWDPDAPTEVGMQRDPNAASAPNNKASPSAAPNSFDSVTNMSSLSTAANSTEVEVKQPTVYSVVADLPGGEPDNRPLNVWASWLTGQPVHGPAIVSLVRCTTTEGGPKLSWRSYPWEHLWRTVKGLFPVAQYTQSLHVKILGKLPQKYSSNVWIGITPYDLLRHYCARNAWRCGLEPTWTERMSDTGEESQPLVGTLAVTAFGTGRVLEETADCRKNLEEAKQEAALKLLHRLQDVDAAALMSNAIAFVPRPSWIDSRADSMAESVDVIEGDSATSGRPVQPGAVVKVNYKLFLTSDDLPADTGLSLAPITYPFEEKANFSFALGTGSVAPCLEKLVTQCPVGGTVHSRGVAVCLDGADPLGVSSTTTCQLQVCVLEQTRPGPKGPPPGPRLFSPPLSQQRYDFIAQTCCTANAKFLLDIGCGEGSLIDYLVRNAGDQLDRVYGMDISKPALISAKKKLDKLGQLSVEANGGATEGNRSMSAAGALEGAPRLHPSLTHSVETQLFHGSVSDISLVRHEAWGALQSCDMAVLVEVIEHLEEDVLQLLGPTVLGGLHPQTVVMTTPNWEYNKMLRAAQTEDLDRSWPGPPGKDGWPLRNSDHKFEWDRKEFKRYCQNLAKAFGYHVTFHGIGNAVREEEVLSSSSWSGSQDVGCASQAAVFTRAERVTHHAITPHSDALCVNVPPGKELPMAEDDAGSVEGSWEGGNADEGQRGEMQGQVEELQRGEEQGQTEEERRGEVQGQLEEATGETNQSNKRSTPTQESPSSKLTRTDANRATTEANQNNKRSTPIQDSPSPKHARIETEGVSVEII